LFDLIANIKELLLNHIKRNKIAKQKIRF
jgi:hypothetical protein